MDSSTTDRESSVWRVLPALGSTFSPRLSRQGGAGVGLRWLSALATAVSTLTLLLRTLLTVPPLVQSA